MDVGEALGAIATFAAGFGIVIQLVVAGIRQALPNGATAPSWVWMLLSAVLGVGITLSLTVPTVVVPGTAPDWYKRVILGLVAAAGSGAWHETKNAIRSVKLRNEQQVSGGPAPESADRTPV